MNTKSPGNPTTEKFISRWKSSGASERANYQLFLTELCELLGVEKPRPASDKVHEATYTFERPVEFDDGDGKKATNFIDLYKQHCFVLEAKQGADKAVPSEAELLGGAKAKTKMGTATRDTRTWEREMKRAKEQALRYARSLPASEGWPPFLAVVDVGFCIDLYSDFARQGKTYIPFPGPLNYRITLADLEKEEIQLRLRQLFTDPLDLDPSKRAAKVTRELAERLAKLAALLEQSGHLPEKVAGFLMRCLFTMFAEDVQLLPERSFTKLLQDYKHNLHLLPEALQALWISMDKGGFDPALRTLIPQFNGFLFKEQEAIPLTDAQLDLLILASEANWADVEPAIFGTLLERALQPRERHKLGAHYTPRAYVERLVMPTIIEPLREEWEAARTASAILETKGDDAGALKEIDKFHRRLCSIKVLDPACGSGNFLYVTLEHLKRLEGEVAEYIAHFPRQLGLDMTGGYTVTPEQLLGLEVNPRAAAIADVVLWIGYLQWHFRTKGHAKRLEDPILRQYGNIVLQDAVLSYTDKKPRLDNNGEPITRWDGHTTKQHPATGLEVPDEMALTPLYDYIDPSPATWPKADFIVGNPPFIGPARMRDSLGDGYAEALRKAYKGVVPESVDFVMYWWHKAAELVRNSSIECFGFITTNSIKQTFSRRIIESHMNSTSPISISLAIPDHPWVDSTDGAAVEIAMTVVQKGKISGRLLTVISECETDGLEVEVSFLEQRGNIHADLSIGAAITSVTALQSNAKISSRGVQLIGAGFIVSEEDAVNLGLKRIPALTNHIREYRNGKDLTDQPRGVKVIDLFGLSIEDVRSKFPEVYQWVYDRVKPERDLNNRLSYKNNWWIFGEPRSNLRPALVGLSRYIATVETSKHRFFTFMDQTILPDNMLIAIAVDDAYYLGILSSNIHIIWSLATGSDLGGNTPRYNKSRCFETFSFPEVNNDQRQLIRTIAEQLDRHRKRQQALHSTSTITDMYNVLEKVRIGEKLNAKEQKIHEQGLINILLQLHHELDDAVAAAYGWPANLTNEEILEKLVALNKERAAE
ncbi:MAG: DNA methyltransferase, partial [Chitinophagaceae bacterium]